ncbi:type IV pilus assembly PilZ [Magnetococcus marinus MC-1]|uniref:Type IV pilus assembly PilZ n=1 Tax=Magnetococcus marinus (strain ATCC BAA-1437 / JCM 17883 / MC-1) TaxID=156889 RepID=A0L8T1_MAGMM|nr:PilZ domain-containing protein [Magnetococcus marinus]ABK44374.1 type IV pilus assembly PilZ [Magnetococcus marinus MC-1]
MAETKNEGKTKRFLKSLIQTGKGKGKDLSVADENGCHMIEDEEAIVKIVTRAIVEHLPVQIQLEEGDAFTFFTYFEKENDEITYLEQARYVLVDALDPPLGNIKIRSAVFVEVSMFTELHLVRTKLRFQKIIEGKTIQMSFPRYLQQEPQKRAMVRAKLESQWKFSLEITRESGVKFAAKAYDISTGGVAIYYKEKIPKITEGSRVETIIYWPEGPPIRVDSVIIGQFSKQGYTGYRIRFLVGSFDLNQALGKVVSLAQRMSLTKRTRLFNKD